MQKLDNVRVRLAAYHPPLPTSTTSRLLQRVRSQDQQSYVIGLVPERYSSYMLKVCASSASSFLTLDNCASLSFSRRNTVACDEGLHEYVRTNIWGTRG